MNDVENVWGKLWGKSKRKRQTRTQSFHLAVLFPTTLVISKRRPSFILSPGELNQRTLGAKQAHVQTLYKPLLPQSNIPAPGASALVMLLLKCNLAMPQIFFHSQ